MNKTLSQSLPSTYTDRGAKGAKAEGGTQLRELQLGPEKLNWR